MELNLDQYPIYVEQKLQWGEMDAFNHVNNTVYFKFFENARISFMAESGIMNSLEGEKIGPILAHTQASFKIPLTFPDFIKTYLKVKSIGNTSFIVEHVIWSQEHSKIACTGESVTVMINYENQDKIPIPDWMRKRLEKYM